MLSVAKLFLLVFATSVNFNEVCTLNILGIFPYQGRSHFFVFQPYLEELAKRGHNLTVISHFPLTKPLNNYHDISLAGETSILEDVFPIKRSYYTLLQITWFLVDKGTENCKTTLANKDVQNLLKSQAKFDVVVVEQFNSDCALGLAYKLDAPVVGLTSHVLMPHHYSRLGIPENPSFTPSMFFEGGTKPSFYQRIERTIFNTYFKILYKYGVQRVDQNTLAEYFSGIPPLEELARNIKFMLSYQNFILAGSRLLPANVIEVGGYHIAKPKPLPEELKKFIDESEHGVIYISFGSMLKPRSTPRDKLEAIISALSELPQRVLWKWDDDLPSNSKNIHTSKWLPQNDILAHPNVLAFYSHCGMLSTSEAIYNGVPVVGMPIFGDQPSNAAAIEESGLGVQIQITELTKENLLHKLKTILDPKFREKVKLLSKAWHDRPISAMDSAIYWTEYAARYRNFTFRTAAADVPLYQYLCLDVLFVFVAAFLVICISIRFLLKLLKTNSNKTESDKTSRRKPKKE